MAPITQDISFTFLGQYQSSPFRSEEALYGVTAAGQVVKLFDPRFDLDLPADSQGAYFYTSSFTKVGDDLYFALLVADADPRQPTSLQIMRLTSDGMIQEVAFIPEASFTNYGYPGDARLTGMEFEGNYVLAFSPGWIEEGGFPPTELMQITPDGEVTQLSQFERPDYPGVLPGFVLLGDEIYAIGDQRTPSDIEELWRVNPDGSFEFLFSDGINSVADIESHGGKAWFITQDNDPNINTGDLYSVVPGGDAVNANLPDSIVPFELIDAGSRLYLLHTSQGPGGGTYLTFSRVTNSGELRPALNSQEFIGIFDIVEFGGGIYFTGGTVSESGIQESGKVYRLNADGSASELAGYGEGIPDGFAARLTIADGRLCFSGIALVDDGFGGVQQVGGVIVAMDENEQFEFLTHLPGAAPDVYGREQIQDFDIDAATPVVGTLNPDILNGTGRGELIQALDGDDTVSSGRGGDYVIGGGGNDTIRGESGYDQLFGGDGNDRLTGGLGTDKLSGGAGRDVLTGSGGADTFIYRSGDGVDRVADFKDDIDTLAFGGTTEDGITRVDSFIANYAQVVGGNVVFNFGNGKLTIAGFSDLSALADDIVLWA